MYFKVAKTAAAAPAKSKTHCTGVGCTRPHSGHLNAERGMRRAHPRQRLIDWGLLSMEREMAGSLHASVAARNGRRRATSRYYFVDTGHGRAYLPVAR